MSDTPRTDACWDDESCNILMHSRQLERELAEANRIIKECLSVMPVGYIPSHTPENLPAKIESLVKELEENTTIRHERVAEELAKVTESLRKAIVWAEAASHRITDRQNINWTYLNEARATLEAMQNGGAV